MKHKKLKILQIETLTQLEELDLSYNQLIKIENLETFLYFDNFIHPNIERFLNMKI